MTIEDAGDEKRIRVQLEFRHPEGLKTQFANAFTIQAQEGFCYLSFYEVRLPMAFGGPESLVQAIKDAGAIPADAVARMAVPTEKVPEILKSIQTLVTRLGLAVPSDSSEGEQPK